MFNIIVLATGNQNKVKEIRELLKDSPIKIKSIADYGSLPTVVEDGDTFVIVAIYVDSVLALSPSAKAVKQILETANKAFDIARVGFPKWFLGIRVTRVEISTIFLDQKQS